MGFLGGHLSTKDFVTFTEHPIAIEAGERDEPDLLAGAGSVIGPVEGRYIAFYCGINPHAPATGKPEQVVLRAFSEDLMTFEKDTEWQLQAPAGYYTHAWRDPFVFRQSDGSWEMLLCTQLDQVPGRRSGVIGRIRSVDLDNWELEDPLWQPGITLAPECPETFALDYENYILFSTYSDRFAVRYRRRDAEKWAIPAWDTLDSNDLYAATSVNFNGERILIGWLATRAGDRDCGERQWGGDLVAHKLVVREDGSLGTVPLESRTGGYNPHPLDVQVRKGEWSVDANSVSSAPAAGLNWLSLAEVDTRKQSICANFTVSLDADSEESGIALFADEEFSRGYLLRFEPRRGRFVFDRRPHKISVPFDYDAERGYVSQPDFEIERPLREGLTHEVSVILEGTCLSVYVDDVALTTRAYDLRDGLIAAYVSNGSIGIHNASVGVRA